MVAEPSVAKAVELMTKAGVWTSGSPVEPSAFGLSSLSVRAVVTAMTGQLGIQACDCKTPAELLRSCAVKITAILAKNTGGGGAVTATTDGVGGGIDDACSGVSNVAIVNPSTPALAATPFGGGGGLSPVAMLDVSGAKADQQAKCEGAMFQWLLAHTPGIHADTSLNYIKTLYAAKMTTIDRLAKRGGKEPGYLLSLGVDEDDADEIVQAMRDAHMLMAP